MLDLAKADGQHAVFKDGFDLFFFDWYRQCDGAGKLAPVTLLQDIVLYAVLIARTQRTLDGQLVVGNADI